MSELPKKNAKLTNQLVENIKDLLNAYMIETGMANVPMVYVEPMVAKNLMGIREIVEVANTIVDKNMYPQGLATKSRRRDLVMKRQVVSYICRSYGFQFHQIANGLGVNHATIIHGVNTVKNLLKNKDPEMLPAYETIVTALTGYYKEKYGENLPEIG